MEEKHLEDLRLYVLIHFPRWIKKSPLYFENIKYELPGFITALQNCFKENNINSFNMDWLLDMTPVEIRSKVKKIEQAKEDMEFLVWEDKVYRTIKEASNDEVLYYALLMYLDLREHPFAEIPKPEQPNKHKEVYKTQNLFKVGLLFAKGEMNKYFTIKKDKTVMNLSAPKIAKELGNSSYEKFILASINNYTSDKENGNKNIFNSRDMMNKIIAHCEAENINVDAYFKSRLPLE